MSKLATTIRLTRGYVALIDWEDFDRVSKIKWQIFTSKDRLYAQGWNPATKRTVLMHRYILSFTFIRNPDSTSAREYVNSVAS